MLYRPAAAIVNRPRSLAAGDSADDQKGFGAFCDRIGQRSVGRVVRQVFFASEEPHERPALLRDAVAHRAAQHWKSRLDRVEHRTLRWLTVYVDLHLARNLRE